jgi:hypothetical protein
VTQKKLPKKISIIGHGEAIAPRIAIDNTTSKNAQLLLLTNVETDIPAGRLGVESYHAISVNPETNKIYVIGDTTNDYNV